MSQRSTAVRQVVAIARRLGAAGGVALLLLLTLSSASPAFHQWLHADGATDATDNCAIVLFASGVTLASAALLVCASPQVWAAVAHREVEELFLTTERYRLRPERGPPLC